MSRSHSEQIKGVGTISSFIKSTDGIKVLMKQQIPKFVTFSISRFLALRLIAFSADRLDQEI